MRLRVLLVEDDLANRLTLGALLEDEGFSVVEAESFAQGLQLLTTTSDSYDVVLVDLDLGDGRGADLAPEVRRRHPSARLLSLSGSDRAPDPWADASLMKGGDVVAVLAALAGERRSA